MNIGKATDILQQLLNQGVSTFCLCPGARNAPFVALLEANPQLETLTFYDERSAGFFALGRARRNNNPVAVITTSGTAVSELLSPVIEAWHSYVPLVVISADRPKRMRGTGAPQAIEQSQLFQNYVENSWDIEADQQVELQLSRQRPSHINICFDEPLLDSPVVKSLKAPLNHSLSPKVIESSRQAPSWSLKSCLIVVGGLKPSQRQVVWDFISKHEVPIFAEALSGLRPLARDHDHLVQTDAQVRKLLKSQSVQTVLRIGDVPVGRFWRDLEDLKQIAVHSVSDKNFSGLSHGALFFGEITSQNLNSLEILPWQFSPVKELGQASIASQIQSLYQTYPQSEVALFAELNQTIPVEDSVFVGNSLPIREWDLVDHTHAWVSASRGVNGIDGQLSTALGWQEQGKPLWVILGDLTTLYDFSAFWLTPYLREKHQQVNVVVVNNKGGQIFSRIFSQEMFRNRHDLNFRCLAEMWGWHYQKRTSIKSIKLEHKLNLIELNPDSEQSHQFWKAFDQIW